MLPILRIIPVGGVFLAILIVVLALEPPGGRHPMLTPTRGVLVDASQHPEWRQFLMLAAVHRAEELNRLLELPATPTRTPDAGKVAGLPASRFDSDPDDETGTISETPSATIPVDIGETSTFELPVAAPDEKPPVIKAPQHRAPREGRKRATHRTVRARPPGQTAAQFDPLASLFGATQQRSQAPAPAAATPASPPPAVTVTNSY